MEDSANLFALRVCAENRVSVRLFLLPTDEMSDQWYRFGFHGWRREEMSEAIRALVDDGLLQIDSRRLLSITPKGVEFWESRDEPEWEKFSHQRWRTKGNDKRISMMCGSAEHRDRAIGALVRSYRLSYRFGLRNMRFRRVSAWEATYWKTLDAGYYFSCDVRSAAFEISKQTDLDPSFVIFFPWGKTW